MQWRIIDPPLLATERTLIVPWSFAIDVFLQTATTEDVAAALGGCVLRGGHVDAHSPFFAVFSSGARVLGLDVGLGADGAVAGVWLETAELDGGCEEDEGGDGGTRWGVGGGGWHPGGR